MPRPAAARGSVPAGNVEGQGSIYDYRSANPNLCRTYADYRARSRASTLRPRTWTAEMMQSVLLATIISLIQAKAEYPRLEITLALLHHLGLGWFDRSEDMFVVTQEDPQQPAYRYIRGSRFFADHRQECEEVWLQSSQFIILPQDSDEPREVDVEEELRHVLGDSASRLEHLLSRAFEMARENTFYA